MIVGTCAAVVAGLLPVDVLGTGYVFLRYQYANYTRARAGEMVSIGTLFAFVLVCLGVWALRVRRPELRRPFR